MCGGTTDALYMWSDNKHTGILHTDVCAYILHTDVCADILHTVIYRELQFFYVSLIYQQKGKKKNFCGKKIKSHNAILLS